MGLSYWPRRWLWWTKPGSVYTRRSSTGSRGCLRCNSAKFNGEEEAEACFLKAIDIARKQSAKSWELRAATSLARLWQQQGKKKEARDLLAPVYNWFTERFDTADLLDAKALLDALP